MIQNQKEDVSGAINNSFKNNKQNINPEKLDTINKRGTKSCIP